VLPLVPGSPGSGVLVTSRDQLTGLAAAVGARVLPLDVVTEDEARDLLAARLGAARVDAEPVAVTRILTRCARLPLALAIVAARAVLHPDFSLQALVDELGDARDHLDAFDGGVPTADLRAVLSWSYRRLRPAAARMFRLLSLYAGPDITAHAAASLAATPLKSARRTLAELARTHMVAEYVPDRYECHDLLHAYSTELCGTVDTAEERRAAVRRVLDHYLSSARAATSLLDPNRPALEPIPAADGSVPEEFADRERALAWFAAEWGGLVAAVELAHRHNLDTHSWHLARTIAPFLDRRGHWRDFAAVHRIAIVAAGRSGDRAAQADALRGLATACTRLRRFDDALAHHAHAVRLYAELGDRTGEAFARVNYGGVYEAQGRLREALEQAERGLELFRAAGDRLGQGKALNAVGYLWSRLGDHEAALRFCQEALALQEGTGEQNQDQAATWDSIGHAHHCLGQYELAARCYGRALDLLRGSRHARHEAIVLNHLADTQRAAGNLAAARASWRRARDLVDGFDRSDSQDVGAKPRRIDTGM
jgi:tetratricopeptide (TPR) repeat protein